MHAIPEDGGWARAPPKGDLADLSASMFSSSFLGSSIWQLSMAVSGGGDIHMPEGKAPSPRASVNGGRVGNLPSFEYMLNHTNKAHRKREMHATRKDVSGCHGATRDIQGTCS